MYQSLGMDLAACAKYLHVTERTLHNWLSGKHDIPFVAYKLLRLLNRMDLPGQAWDGWCFRSGKLWSPEGRSFDPVDASWWGLLVRRAHAFEYHARRVGLGASRTAPGKLALHGAGSEAPGPTAAAVGRREAPALDLVAGLQLTCAASAAHVATRRGVAVSDCWCAVCLLASQLQWWRPVARRAFPTVP